MTKTETEVIYDCREAMSQRIDTTMDTSDEVFDRCSNFLDAASCLIGSSGNVRAYVLSLQVIALELMKVYPSILETVHAELDKQYPED